MSEKILNNKKLIEKLDLQLKKNIEAFEKNKKCGKISVMINGFQGGFGNFKIIIEEDFK